MSHRNRRRWQVGAVAIGLIAAGVAGARAQDEPQPTNDAPNPYRTTAPWGTLPAGRTWGALSAVAIDRDGESVWVADRCGSNPDRPAGASPFQYDSCAYSNLPPVLKFDASGRLLSSFGAGMFVFPHKIYVDHDGNLWVADQRAANERELAKSPDAKGKGHVVVKFSPEGKVLLRLGTPGVAGNPPEALTEPTSIVMAPNGTVYISEGHQQGANAAPTTVARISMFAKDGQYVRSFGKLGSGPGEFRGPHDLAMDAQGRLFVADRGNMRVQILSQDGTFIAEWRQFSRPSGVYVRGETLYVTDSESNGVAAHPGWRRGIRIGSVRDGRVTAFIPDPQELQGTSAGEGLAVDARGNVFGAEVGQQRLARHAPIAASQSGVRPVNDLPNPYETVRSWAPLPDGQTWGSTAGIDMDPDGRTVWAINRCGANTCAGSTVPVVLKIDRSGKLLRSFGGGMFVFPHGMHVDRAGNVWVTDGRAATPEELAKFPDAKGKGHTVVKFSPDGRVLLTLGTPGAAGTPPTHFNEPTDVVTAPSGDIFVADGHSGQNAGAGPDTVARIVKFDRNGRFLKMWGTWGSGPGEFKTPHALVVDGQGRLLVADRANHRIQVFDQEGTYLAEWKEFSRVSGMYIRNDTLYAIDSESNAMNHPGWRKGVRIGSVRDGKVRFFVAPHMTDRPEGAAGEGIAVDEAGNIITAENTLRGLTRYIKRLATD